jgi:gluconolactonase
MVMAVDGPSIVAEVPAFTQIFANQARPIQLAEGHVWLEGPVWTPDGVFICSDIWADTMYRFDGKTLVVWRSHSGQANGNTLDREGRLITCQHVPHAVQRTEKDGATTMLVDSYQQKPLNSPNDVIVKSDGSIWFTDPIYGLNGRKQQQESCRVYRLDPETRVLTAICDTCEQPNGLCFSPGEKQLYIADSGSPHRIVVSDVVDGQSISTPRVFAIIAPGVPDGIRCDATGRLWVCAGDGVHVYAPDGTLLGRILLNRVVSNCCFGGQDGRTLFMTSIGTLWSIPLAPSLPVHSK